MMDFGVFLYAYSGGSPLRWKDKSIASYINDYFAEPPVLHDESIKSETMFNARNLERIAGIEIEWTDNLADHLRTVGGNDKRVAIFHHASFLWWQQR
jgi:hypothetical protein